MNPENLGVDAAAITAAYLVGQYAEQRAKNLIGQNRDSAVLAAEGAGVDRRKFRMARLVTPLALIGAVAGYSLASGLYHNEGSTTESSAAVFTVVDHDAISQSDGVAGLEDKIAGSFYNGDQGVVNHLITAHNGTSDPTTPNGLNNDSADGPASVETTVDDSLSDSFSGAPESQTNLLKKVNAKSGAEVVLIDHYDVISSPQTLESKAQIAGNIPVFVLDITGSGKPPVNRPNIEKIATDTGGQYWAVSPTNYQTVISDMESSIKPHNSLNEHNGNSFDISDIVVGLALTGIGVYMYTRRRSETATS